MEPTKNARVEAFAAEKELPEKAATQQILEIDERIQELTNDLGVFQLLVSGPKRGEGGGKLTRKVGFGRLFSSQHFPRYPELKPPIGVH